MYAALLSMSKQQPMRQLSYVFISLNFKLHGSLFCLDTDVKDKTTRKRSLHQGGVSFSYQTEENLSMFPRHLSVRLAQLFFLSRAI